MLRARLLIAAGAILAIAALVSLAFVPFQPAGLVPFVRLGLFGAGVGMITAGVFRLRLIARVNRLSARALEIAGSGAVGARVDAPAAGELGELTAAMNRMLEAAEASQQELRENADLFRHLFDASPFPVAVSRVSDQRVMAVNQRMCDQFAVTYDEAVGQSVLDYYVDPSQRALLVEELRTHGRAENMLAQVRAPGERPFWALISARLATFQGEPAVIAVLNDIDERVTAEHALRASEQRLVAQSEALTELTAGQSGHTQPFDERLRTILERASRTLGVERAAVWRIAPDGQSIECLDLYRHDDDVHETGHRLPRADFPSYFEAIERDRIVAAEDAAHDPRTAEFAGGYLEPYGIGAMLDVPLRHNDRAVGVLCLEHVGGPRVWTVDEQNFAVSVANLVVVAQTDAERQEALTRVADSEARSRLVLDTAHDAFIGMDSDGRITAWNAQAAATFGWSREEAVGRVLADTIIPKAYREAHVRGLARFLATGDAPVVDQRLELSALHRDGREFPIEITITRPIRAEHGFFFGAFLRDISERRQREAELRHAKESAEAATRAKSEFLASMSHELRTPLNGVLGYTQLLQRDRTMTAAQLESLDAIAKCGVHLLELINDVLDLSKIEAGKVEVELAPCNVHQAVVDLQHVILEPARRKGLGLAVEVAPEVPPRVVLDGRYLRQVLLNLLGNAVKFTAKGRVSLRIARQGDRLRFEVSDTGIGIEPESLDAIFEAFRQTRSGAAAGGTGLGLAISQRLVRAMGGEIEVESYVGRGSRFAFDLPLLVAEGDTAAEDAAEDEWLDARLAPGESLTVLVVDDSSVNRRILVSLLESAGVRAITAAGGLEAVELTRRHKPDVVLMDLRMDDLDGFEATRRIHADRATAAVPVIAVTASAFRNARESAREAGCVDFVAKPVRAAVLFEKLERHAGTRFERAARAATAEAAPALELPAGDAARGLAERLRQALAIGSVTDLDALARDLANRDPEQAELGRRIERLASQFDFDALETLAVELEARGRGAHVPD